MKNMKTASVTKQTRFNHQRSSLLRRLAGAVLWRCKGEFRANRRHLCD